MSKDAVINELNRYLKTPSLTFEKGLMQTDNDNVFGYVSDLKNMEVRNNIIERRKGSQYLSNPLVTNKFIFLEEIVVSGVHILLGINDKKEVCAFVDKWTEIQFPVYKKGLGTLTTDSYKFSFERGEKFWLLEDNNFYKIVNDSGDTYRINKHGYIQFMSIESDAKVTNNTNYKPHQMTDDARYERAPDITLVQDTTKQTPEIRGDVRIADINRAGYRGLWSDPLYLTDWESTYIAKMKSSFLTYDPISKLHYNTSSGGMITESNDESIYIKPFPTSVDDGAWLQFTYDYEYIDTNFTNPQIYDTDVTLVYDSDNKMVYMYFDDASSLVDLQITDIHTFINLSEITFLSPEDGTGSTLQADTYPKINKGFSIYAEMSGEESFVNIPKNYVDKVSNVLEVAAAAHRLSDRFLIRLNDLNNSMFEKALGTPQDISIAQGAATFYSLTGGIATAKISLCKTSPLSTTMDRVLPKIYFKIDDKDLSKYNDPQFFIDKGLNLWERARITDNTATVVGYSNNRLFYNYEELEENDAIATSSDNYPEISRNGIAVWNDGFIKAISQKFLSHDNISPQYSDKDGVDKVYNKNDTKEGGRVVNQPPSKTYIDYMPIVSLRDTKLTRSYHTLNFAEEIIRDPQHVATNSDILFVVQGKRIWLGDTNSMLLKNNIDVDFSVMHMQPFYNGVLLFTNKGIFLLDRNGTIASVNTSNIKSEQFINTCVGASGVFGISTTDEVVFVHMVFDGASKPYAKCDGISGATYSIQWSDDSKMVFIDDTIWIARDYDIFGFRAGGWKSKHVFEHKINKISSFKNKLVVSFYDKPKISDLDNEELEYEVY